MTNQPQLLTVSKPKFWNWSLILQIHSQVPLIDNQLQSSVRPDAEPVIIIELETPEEIPEDDTPDINIQPQNESEDTLSSELLPEEDFPSEYFQTTDDGISSDKNFIDDYY